MQKISGRISDYFQISGDNENFMKELHNFLKRICDEVILANLRGLIKL
jgi:hypothetical protein